MTAGDANHGALMDRVYRRQRYIYDFTRKYYLLGRDRLIREMSLSDGAAVLEVGCGTARNLIAVAKRWPTAQLYGLDASSEMLRTASQSLEKTALTNRAVLRQGYAEALTPALFGRDKPFDAIIFSYSLSMIPDWNQALVAASNALSPDGQIHVVDFGDLGGSGLSRAVLRRWLAIFHVEPREELLRTLEARVNREKTSLRTLPGRYAFLFTGRRDALALAGRDVA
ncbi:MAG TPA: class I SAM-dependent methyltransferase [Rhizomicrobium sp.]|jgi:S-adenosylmethionine-diacylgycerolhomoserine-N-methlytransferase